MGRARSGRRRVSSAVHSEASARARACSGSGARRCSASDIPRHRRRTRRTERPRRRRAAPRRPTAAPDALRRDVRWCRRPAGGRRARGSRPGPCRRQASPRPPATPRRARPARRAHRSPGGPRPWWRSPRPRLRARRARARSTAPSTVRPATCRTSSAKGRGRTVVIVCQSRVASSSSRGRADGLRRPRSRRTSPHRVPGPAVDGFERLGGRRWPAARRGPCCGSRAPRAPACCPRRRRPPACT